MQENKSKERYLTIVFPGQFGQHVQETWTIKQILNSYFSYWAEQMIKVGRGDQVNEHECIQDWVNIHWAEETDQFGNKL